MCSHDKHVVSTFAQYLFDTECRTPGFLSALIHRYFQRRKRRIYMLLRFVWVHDKDQVRTIARRQFDTWE